MKKHIGILFEIFFVVVMLLSCETGKDSNRTTEIIDSGVPFESFSPHSISVKNNTGERLIAFKGTIELNKLISGVPAFASNHGLRMDANLFAETGEFVLLFITEKVFIENKDNLHAVQNKPFASIYAFYTKEGSNDLIHTVSEKSAGKLKLNLNNDSPFNAEIRLDSPTGEVWCCIAPGAKNIALNIEPGDYTFYPIFKKYIKRMNEIYTFVPRFKNAVNEAYREELAISDNSTVWNVGDVLNSSQLNLSLGGFFLTIENKSSTGVRLKKGDKEFMTSVGLNIIQRGTNETFFIPFPKSSDGSYPDSFKILDLTIGAKQYPNLIPEYEYKLDTKYIIVVKGEEGSNLELEPLRENGKVDINDLLGL